MIYQHGQMQPLYEAMAIGSSTINWLERQERERSDFDLQFSLAKLVRAMEDIVDEAKKNPLLDASQDSIAVTAALVSMLLDMLEMVVAKARDNLSKVTTPLQQTVGLLTDQVEHLSDRMADVLEAWEICLDPELSKKLATAVAGIDRSKQDIPNWRDIPELVSD